ncbi:2-keto-4-pentenoate hydratase [Bradyrhizobium oligotrophicum]|uniref:2-keto-4-pentenoate hydratase n=1 Tax=Bradyrhizobium oligotrophicum TaxID=44255 RepID=UPI003EBC7DE6
MEAEAAAAAAAIIAQARAARTLLGPLPLELQPEDELAGYVVQRAAHALVAARHGARVGYKIGCTSKVMQDYLQIPHPCAGGVFAHGVHDGGVSLPAAGFIRVGVECEIAMRLARDLAPSGAPFTAEDVAAEVGACHPAIEIVDDRYVTWETLGAPTLIADDFFAAGCVLGAAVERAALPDLRGVRGRALINGEVAGEGTGADVLGHPFQALAWLANHLAANGEGLKAGELVLTGSLVKTVWLGAGDRVRMELDGLGAVEMAFV